MKETIWALLSMVGLVIVVLWVWSFKVEKEEQNGKF